MPNEPNGCQRTKRSAPVRVQPVVLQPYYADALTTIYHGDARTILPQLAAADALITDPVWPNCIVKLYGQDDPHAMLAEMFHALPQMPKRAAIHLGCDSDPRFLTAVPDALAFFRVCWFKLARVGYKGRLLMTGDVAYLFGEPPKSRPGAHVIPGECMDADGKGKQSDHPCPRKLKHASWLVNWWSEEGETILDPFMGSGTTAVAALKHGRRFIGFELNRGYFATARRRVSRLEKDRGAARPVPAPAQAAL